MKKVMKMLAPYRKWSSMKDNYVFANGELMNKKIPAILTYGIVRKSMSGF